MFSSRHDLKMVLAYEGNAYAIGRVFWFIWRWQISERLGAQSGLALSKRLAKSAARSALRSRPREDEAAAA